MIPPVFEATDRPSVACIAAAEQGENARKSGDLLQSRERFARCAASECPAVVRRDCGTWLEEVARQTPSVVLGARDGQGKDVLDATASIDGVVVQRRLDGSPVDLNPGPHVVRVEIPGTPAATLDVVLRAGEKNRPIVALFRAPEPAVPPPAVPRAPLAPVPGPEHPPAPSRGLPIGAYVLGGVGLVALGVFGYFAYRGKEDADTFRTTCAPGCPSNDVAGIRTNLLVADVALGAAIASLAGATWVGFRF